MWFFVVMLIGVIGTILIKQSYNKLENKYEKVPVRIDNLTTKQPFKRR